jgi:hypothetical protein
MNTNIVNKDGIYSTESGNYYGVNYSFSMSGSNWAILTVENTSPLGPNKFYVYCADENGAAIEEVLKGNPPSGLGKIQNNYSWIKGNHPSGPAPQIDYIVEESGVSFFKVVAVMTDNLIEVESSGGLTGNVQLGSVSAFCTKGIQLESLILNCLKDNTVKMANNNVTSPQYSAPTILHFTEGSGPVYVFSEADGGQVKASFKKSLERLS